MEKIRLLHESHETSYVTNAERPRFKIDRHQSSKIFDLELMGITPWQGSFRVTRNALQLPSTDAEDIAFLMDSNIKC